MTKDQFIEKYNMAAADYFKMERICCFGGLYFLQFVYVQEQ